MILQDLTKFLPNFVQQSTNQNMISEIAFGIWTIINEYICNTHWYYWCLNLMLAYLLRPNLVSKSLAGTIYILTKHIFYFYLQWVNENITCKITGICINPRYPKGGQKGPVFLWSAITFSKSRFWKIPIRRKILTLQGTF